MRNGDPRTRLGMVAILAAVLFAGLACPPPAVAQVKALLPNKSDVPETEALPIDGVWTVSTIGKRIHIERGRAYAVDPWLHLFVLQVEPDMVVLRNFRRSGAGAYTADDLPLLGPATFRLKPDGNLHATVQGALGPAAYDLIRVEADDPAALDGEIAALNGDAVPPPESEPAPPPAAEPTPPSDGSNDLADCRKLGIDPKTGDVACFD